MLRPRFPRGAGKPGGGLGAPHPHAPRQPSRGGRRCRIQELKKSGASGREAGAGRGPGWRAAAGPAAVRACPALPCLLPPRAGVRYCEEGQGPGEEMAGGFPAAAHAMQTPHATGRRQAEEGKLCGFLSPQDAGETLPPDREGCEPARHPAPLPAPPPRKLLAPAIKASAAQPLRLARGPRAAGK